MTGKKILVTGSMGLLGSSLIKNLNFKNVIGLSSKELDILETKLLDKKLNNEKPDIIIHTAAFTNVEACEVEIDKAYKVNVIGTQNIVNYCIDKDVLLVYISSAGIYGSNKNEAYTEFDDVKPTTIHHRSKYEGEKVIQNHLSKYLILRTGWLYGGEKTHNKNFVYKRYQEAISNDIMYSDNTQIGNPTYVKNLVEQIELLIFNNKYGIFNCANEAIGISRYDYVKKIVELFDLKCHVEIASNEMFKRSAPVSKNESVINYKLELLGLNIMKNWEESLTEYITILKEEI